MHLGKKVREGIAVDNPDEAPITAEEPVRVRRFWEKRIVTPTEEPEKVEPVVEPAPVPEPVVEPEKAPEEPTPAKPKEPVVEPEPEKVQPEEEEEEPDKDPLFPDYVPEEWPERITSPSEPAKQEPVKSN